MTSNHQAPGGGPVQFGTAEGRSAPDRAEHYRRKAAQHRQMAMREPLGAMRDLLLKLARDYDRLADRLDE